MTNTRRSRFVVLTKDDQPFAGHKLGSLAAAIHALLRFGNTPMSEDDIIRNTGVRSLMNLGLSTTMERPWDI